LHYFYCYRGKNLTVIVWIVCAMFISCAYKSMLLSSLIPLVFEKTIETVQDFVDQDMAFLVNVGSGKLKLQYLVVDSTRRLID
jgi:hypothetical protein